MPGADPENLEKGAEKLCTSTASRPLSKSTHECRAWMDTFFTSRTLTLSSNLAYLLTEASFMLIASFMLLHHEGSAEARERGKERMLAVIPCAPSFSPIHLPHPLGASAEERVT